LVFEGGVGEEDSLDCSDSGDRTVRSGVHFSEEFRQGELLGKQSPAIQKFSETIHSRVTAHLLT